MSRCQSCGLENIETHRIEVDGMARYVCLRCYSEIQKNLAELGRQSAIVKDVADQVDALEELVETHSKHLKTIDEYLEAHDKHLEAQDEILRITNERLDMIKETVGKNARINDQNWTTVNEKYKPKWNEMEKRINELSEEFQHLKSRIEALENKPSEKK